MAAVPAPQRISVVGLGKLGSCMAAAFASRGFRVVGNDVQPGVVQSLSAGKTALIEPGLQELITAHRASVAAVAHCADAVAASDTTFVVVPTPTEVGGGFSLKFVLPAMRSIARGIALKDSYHVVVLSSTVLPGAMESIVVPALEQESGKKCGKDFGVCYNPLFVALGSVLKNILSPDFVLIGETDLAAGQRLQSIYKQLCGEAVKISRMSLVNAELSKLAVNTFITAKISFANMLSGLCEKLPGADVDVVAQAIGQDSRIGLRYLKGGLSYGGPCFPRDNMALSALANQVGYSSALPQTTDSENRRHAQEVAGKIKGFVNAGSSIAILGLSYKPDTDVIDESPGVNLASLLADSGYRVVVYDPLAMGAASAVLASRVEYASSLERCLQSCDVIVIAGTQAEFMRITPESIPSKDTPVRIVDCWRILRERFADAPHVQYIALGVGTQSVAPAVAVLAR